MSIRNHPLYQAFFWRYVLVSITATMVDWAVFRLATAHFQIFYQWALIISMSLGAIVAYVFNKLFTFRCQSSRIGLQLIISLMIAIGSLGLSVLLMSLFVDEFGMKIFLSRVVTTVIIFFLNMLLTRYITFCKRFFR